MHFPPGIETSSSTTTATNATANSNNSIGGGQPSDADPSGAATSSSVDTDIESAIHILSVFCNLLFSYDGIGDRTASFVNRLKKFVQSCNDIALNIRESLFLEMENSFYFFGGSVDIPIVSEDQ